MTAGYQKSVANLRRSHAEGLRYLLPGLPGAFLLVGIGQVPGAKLAAKAAAGSSGSDLGSKVDQVRSPGTSAQQAESSAVVWHCRQWMRRRGRKAQR